MLEGNLGKPAAKWEGFSHCMGFPELKGHPEWRTSMCPVLESQLLQRRQVFSPPSLAESLSFLPGQWFFLFPFRCVMQIYGLVESPSQCAPHGQPHPMGCSVRTPTDSFSGRARQLVSSLNLAAGLVQTDLLPLA